MSKGFTFTRESKFLDNLEQIATEWMEEAVLDHYAVMSIEELSEEEIDEVVEYLGNEEVDEYVSLGLRNLISTWELDNG